MDYYYDNNRYPHGNHENNGFESNRRPGGIRRPSSFEIPLLNSVETETLSQLLSQVDPNIRIAGKIDDELPSHPHQQHVQPNRGAPVGRQASYGQQHQHHQQQQQHFPPNNQYPTNQRRSSSNGAIPPNHFKPPPPAFPQENNTRRGYSVSAGASPNTNPIADPHHFAAPPPLHLPSIQPASAPSRRPQLNVQQPAVMSAAFLKQQEYMAKLQFKKPPKPSLSKNEPRHFESVDQMLDLPPRGTRRVHPHAPVPDFLDPVQPDAFDEYQPPSRASSNPNSRFPSANEPAPVKPWQQRNQQPQQPAQSDRPAPPSLPTTIYAASAPASRASSNERARVKFDPKFVTETPRQSNDDTNDSESAEVVNAPPPPPPAPNPAMSSLALLKLKMKLRQQQQIQQQQEEEQDQSEPQNRDDEEYVAPVRAPNRRVTNLRAVCAAAESDDNSNDNNNDDGNDQRPLPKVKPGVHLREPTVKPRPLKSRTWQPSQPSTDDEETVDERPAPVKRVQLPPERHNVVMSSPAPLSARRRQHSDDEPIVSARNHEEDAEQNQDGDDAQAPDDMEVRPCPDCGRKFNPASLERHVRICREVFAKKRAQFDSQGARLADTGLDQVQVDTAAAEKRELLVARNKSRHSWKKESGGLRNAMRAARAASSGNVDIIVAAPAEVDDSLVQCPHCQRRFAEQTAERHIPHCAETKARPQRLQRGAGKGIGAAVRK